MNIWVLPSIRSHTEPCRDTQTLLHAASNMHRFPCRLCLRTAAQTGSAVAKIKRPLSKVSELTRQTIHPLKVHEANVFNMSRHNATITTNTPQKPHAINNHPPSPVAPMQASGRGWLSPQLSLTGYPAQTSLELMIPLPWPVNFWGSICAPPFLAPPPFRNKPRIYAR